MRGTEIDDINDHEYGVMRTNTFLSHDVSVHHSVCALCRRKKGRVKCSCQHLPSVSVDRHQLLKKPTVTKREKDLGHFILFKKNYHELHQLLDVSQFHQESLEEECHLRYCCGDIGSAISSPDSRWRRFLSETAAQKSDRSRIGAFFPDLVNVRYHCPWYLASSSLDRR